MRLLTLAAGVPTTLEYALRRYRDDPVFRAWVSCATAALPSDPLEASRVAEVARLWASANAEDRNAARLLTVQDGEVVPTLDPYLPPSPVIPDTCWEHWLAWQTHIGRHAGTVVLLPTLRVQRVLNTLIFPDFGATAEDVESALSRWGTTGPLVQVPSFFPHLHVALLAGGYQPALTQEVAVMPAAQAAMLSQDLPEGFTAVPVTTERHVAHYAAVTTRAYQESYGADPASPLITTGALLGPDTRAWVVYDPAGAPMRVISGFAAAGMVGAHAGAAVPEVRGMHFSETLLSLVAEWGLSRGCTTLTGAAMPQASPILTRIGATIVAKWLMYAPTGGR